MNEHKNLDYRPLQYSYHYLQKKVLTCYQIMTTGKQWVWVWNSDDWTATSAHTSDTYPTGQYLWYHWSVSIIPLVSIYYLSISVVLFIALGKFPLVFYWRSHCRLTHVKWPWFKNVLCVDVKGSRCTLSNCCYDT